MDGQNPSLMVSPISPREWIESHFMDVSVRTDVPEDMAFSVAVPTGWSVVRDPVAQPPGPDAPAIALARFAPTSDDAPGGPEGAEIVVWAFHLPREMHGWDWLRAWIGSQGYSLIQARQALTPRGIMGDALVSRSRDGVARLHRLATFKDGDVLYLVDGRARMGTGASLDAVQEIFLMAVLRFRLLAPTRQALAEAFDWATLGGDSGVRFLVSALWRQRPAGDAPDGGDALVLDNPRDDTVVGTMIAVLGAPPADPAEIEEITVAKLAANGIVAGPAGDALSEQITETRQATIVRREAEAAGGALILLCARILVVGRPLSLVLLTPGEAEAFEVWAVNRRAFEVAVHTAEQAG